MSFHFIPSIGTVHFQDVRPARVVPGHERHQWDGKPQWGERTTCKKCGCVKHRLKTKPEWCERYQLPGSTELLAERPPCTGKPTSPQPAPRP